MTDQPSDESNRSAPGQVGLRSIVAGVREENAVSARVLQKASSRDAGRVPGDPLWRLVRRSRPTA